MPGASVVADRRDGIVVKRAQNLPLDPRAFSEEFRERFFDDAWRFVGDQARAALDFALAADEGFIEIGERFGQHFSGRPGNLGFLGVDGSQVVAGLLESRNRGVRLVDQTAAALGLKLQLVP